MGKKSQKKAQNKNKKQSKHSQASKNQGKQKKIFHQRPASLQQYTSSLKTETSEIKNKMKRVEIVRQRRDMKNQLKLKQRKQRKKLPAEQRQQPITIQDKQIAPAEQFECNNEEEQLLDNFNSILNNQIPVKILLTTSIRPPTKIYQMLRQLMMVFHNINYYPRQNMSLQELYTYAKKLGYTHVVIVRFTHGWQLVIRLLDGPLAIFKVTGVQFQKKIKHHGLATDHVPELILNNFDSKIGVKVGRMLASIFPQQPEFKGRRVVTFHNQRDFIFFRHHRYIFKDGYDGVNMQEIGPRMTLRLKKFYDGDQSEVKQLEFEAKDNMYVDRKSVYL